MMEHAPGSSMVEYGKYYIFTLPPRINLIFFIFLQGYIVAILKSGGAAGRKYLINVSSTPTQWGLTYFCDPTASFKFSLVPWGSPGK